MLDHSRWAQMQGSVHIIEIEQDCGKTVVLVGPVWSISIETDYEEEGGRVIGAAPLEVGAGTVE